MQYEEKAAVLNDRDNVATALADLEAGTTLKVKVGGRCMTVKLKIAIPFGHKFSLARIELGAPVFKYGEVIGTATSIINPGDYVHIHNVASTRGRGDLTGGKK